MESNSQDGGLQAATSSCNLLRVDSGLGREEISRPCSPSNPLVSFEVKPRDFYIYYVTVENPGDLIKWSFYTKKKNIAFGLFYLNSVLTCVETGEDGLRGGGGRFSSEQIHAIVKESQSLASIIPPPKGVAPSGSLSRSNSQIYRTMAGSEGSLNGPTALSGTGSMKNESSSNLTANLTGIGTGIANNQENFYLATAAFGQPSGSHPFEFIEILPVEKYESYESTINGSYKTPLAGVYALCFDNTFSINTSKHVFVGLRVIPASLLAGHGLQISELPYAGGILGAQDDNVVMASWMMKKKRKKIQGWARRWVQLERNGILSYYASRNGTCRGTIDLSKSSIARVPNRRLITVDSAEMTFHLRALTDDDYEAWTEAIGRFHSAAGIPQDTPVAKVALSEADMRDLVDLETGISTRINFLNETIANLRSLAATDDGSLVRYVSPLEEAFGSLDSLFAQVSSYSTRLRSLHQSLLQPRTVQQTEIELEDVFYDLEITDYSGDSEGSEYADAEMFDWEASVAFLPASNVNRVEFQYRTTLPAIAPPCNISIGSILRKSIGKDSSGMVMPMGLNEPLNGLQRLCEELEYSELLDRAALEEDSLERLVLVSAFAVSAYASCQSRAERKPFNPMLGETFEYIDSARNVRFVSEKVSHRPLVLACHANAPGWEWWQDQKVKTKFWGKSVEYIPSGDINVRFPNGDHFRWTKVVSCLRNVLGSKKWIENYGEMVVENLRTGHSATLSFKSSGSFFGSSSSSSNEVQGTISDGSRTVRLSGRWDDLLMREMENGRLEVVWKANPFPPLYMEYYGFTNFALRLNQLLPGQQDSLPPSDTRLRPDQRMLEEARVEQAEAEQMRLVEKQRQVRTEMEAAGKEWEPRWFRLDGDAWVFGGQYWDAKERRDWSLVPTLW